MADLAGVARDYQILDEAAMRRDVFYSELPRCGLRYSIAAVLLHTPDEFTSRGATIGQGHVDCGEIRLDAAIVAAHAAASTSPRALRGNRGIGVAERA